MNRAFAERKAFRSGEKLARMREDLAVVIEQIAALRDDADEAEVRAVVSEEVDARRQHSEAARHVAAMERSRDDLRARISRAEVEHEKLLDRLFPSSRGGSGTV